MKYFLSIILLIISQTDLNAFQKDSELLWQGYSITLRPPSQTQSIPPEYTIYENSRSLFRIKATFLGKYDPNRDIYYTFNIDIGLNDQGLDMGPSTSLGDCVVGGAYEETISIQSGSQIRFVVNFQDAQYGRAPNGERIFLSATIGIKIFREIENPGDIKQPDQNSFSQVPRLDSNQEASIQKDFGKTDQDTFKQIPVLHGKVESVKFFDISAGVPPKKDRNYHVVFRFTKALMIAFEISFDFPRLNSNFCFYIESIWYNETGKVIGNGVTQVDLDNGWNNAYTYGNADVIKGKWRVGSYHVDFYVSGQKIASGLFQVIQ